MAINGSRNRARRLEFFGVMIWLMLLKLFLVLPLLLVFFWPLIDACL